MKLAGIVYKWVLLSLALSLTMLFFLNFIYFRERINMPSIQPDSSVTDQTKKIVDPKDVTLPAGAKNIGISYLNTYVSCIVDGKLKIYNIEDNKEVTTLSPEKGTIESSYWLDEGDIVLYATNISHDGSNDVKVRVYDMDTQKINENYDAITELPENSVVEKLQYSRAHNNAYVQIKTSETKRRIYTYNIMNNLKRVRQITDAKEIWEMYLTNQVLFTNDNNKIMVYDGNDMGEPIAFATKFTYTVLGIDSMDHIFIGILDENDKIKRMLYGTRDDIENKKFKEQYLTTPQPKENIFISQIGNIYISDGMGKITDIKSKEEKSVSGKVLFVRDEGILTQSDSGVTFTPFN